jgi:shikimate dehydrogenase
MTITHKQYGLIGFPLSHSFSKKYFSEKFLHLGFPNYSYENFELANIAQFPALIKQHTLSGLNVTIPYKEKIIPFLDDLDETAKAIGAVNTIQFKKNKLIGYNTDVIGFEKTFLPLVKPHHHHALILGSGGAEKAVAYVLKKIGIHFQIVSRTNLPNTISYDTLHDFYYRQYQVIINCTPLGMFPSIKSFPALNYQLINPNFLCYDLVYNPVETQFLKKATLQGATVKGGLEMLHSQAEAAWEIWQMD